MNKHGELKINNAKGTIYFDEQSASIGSTHPSTDKEQKPREKLVLTKVSSKGYKKDDKKDVDVVPLPPFPPFSGTKPADEVTVSSRKRTYKKHSLKKPPKQQNNTSGRLAALSKVFVTAAMVIMLIAYGPSAYYAAMQALGVNINFSFRNEELLSIDASTDAVYKPDYRPVFDSTLPEENRVIIRTAGIDTVILEAPEDDYEEALKKGVWREVRFGTPDTRSRPTMLVAHRYGYLAWSVPYRLKNSFYNLPKLKVGDTVEVIWKQRKYVYTIYAEEVSEKPSDYNADLILYTCKDLTSDMAIFKYGKLLEM
jgi:sortase (surface protein transpeptidase)